MIFFHVVFVIFFFTLLVDPGSIIIRAFVSVYGWVPGLLASN